MIVLVLIFKLFSRESLTVKASNRDNIFHFIYYLDNPIKVKQYSLNFGSLEFSNFSKSSSLNLNILINKRLR